MADYECGNCGAAVKRGQRRCDTCADQARDRCPDCKHAVNLHSYRIKGDEGKESCCGNKYKCKCTRRIEDMNEAIKIKPSKRGSLHKALGVGKNKKIPVSDLKAAKNSKSPAIRKKANFALNARKWNHESVERFVDEILDEAPEYTCKMHGPGASKCCGLAMSKAERNPNSFTCAGCQTFYTGKPKTVESHKLCKGCYRKMMNGDF